MVTAPFDSRFEGLSAKLSLNIEFASPSLLLTIYLVDSMTVSLKTMFSTFWNLCEDHFGARTHIGALEVDRINSPYVTMLAG